MAWPTTARASTASPPRSGQATVAGALAEALGRVAPGRRSTLTCAGRTDAGRARPRPGGPLRRARPSGRPASTPSRPGAVLQQPAGPGHRGPGGRGGAGRLRRPALGHRPPLPLPGGERPGGRPAAGRPGLARGRPARPAVDGRGVRRPARRARLPGVLPPGPGHLARRPDPPAGHDARMDPTEHGRRAGTLRAARRAAPAAGSTPALVPALGSLLAFEIEANAFCHQMVRSLVGTLVDVGRGRKRPSDILWILRSADRQQAAQPAPPQGPDPDGGPLRARPACLSHRFRRILGSRRLASSAEGRTGIPCNRVVRIGSNPWLRSGGRPTTPASPDTRHHRTRTSRAHVLPQAR